MTRQPGVLARDFKFDLRVSRRPYVSILHQRPLPHSCHRSPIMYVNSVTIFGTNVTTTIIFFFKPRHFFIEKHLTLYPKLKDKSLPRESPV